MDLGVEGKGYLVVGGTQGMGLATAGTLAREGARVAIAARDVERTKKTAETLSTAHRATVLPFPVDANETDACKAMVDDAAAALGGLAGICVTASGAAAGGGQSAAVWRTSFDSVLLATVNAVDAALPHLVDRGDGTIVTTSAYSIRDPHFERLAYTSLKAAVATYTKTIAREYGLRGVRANCVAPGAIETEAMHAMRGALAEAKGWQYEEAIERMMVEEWHMDVALGRPGQPGEVGDLMAFLLSARAGYLTGATINIDGGTSF
jgi:NAD(P)-dependent dehydrogenase (short-subunit alcohol dehydrogenase family)